MDVNPNKREARLRSWRTTFAVVAFASVLFAGATADAGRPNKKPLGGLLGREGFFVKNPAIPTLALVVLPSALKA